MLNRESSNPTLGLHKEISAGGLDSDGDGLENLLRVKYNYKDSPASFVVLK